MHRLHLLFNTSRPISWVNTAYPFAAGYLIMGSSVDARLIIGTLFFLIPYNLLMYGVNDVYDYESDIRNPRKGGVEGAITPKRYHPLLLGASVVFSAPFIIMLLALGNAQSALVLGAVLFFVVAYSVKGLRFKEIPFLDSITSSIHFVGPLIFAYALIGATTAGWMAAGALFLWGIASHSFGAVQDILPDRAAGIKSIATVLGARRTIYFSLVFYTLAVLMTALIGGLAIIVAAVGLIYPLIVLRYAMAEDKTSPTTRRGWKQFLWVNYGAGAVVTICCILA